MRAETAAIYLRRISSTVRAAEDIISCTVSVMDSIYGLLAITVKLSPNLGELGLVLLQALLQAVNV